MDRFLRGTAATVYLNTASGGSALDADAPPTLSVFREDGTPLVENETASDEPEDGRYSYTFGPNAELDELALKWTALFNGVPQEFTSYAEVVGGHTFGLAEARKRAPIRDFPNLYPDDRLSEARTVAERALEDAAGVSFVPRYGRAVIDGDGTDELLIPFPEPRRVIAVTVDGVELAADELADIEPLDYGTLYRPDGWPSGRRNIEVRVEHGFKTPPGRVSHAALALTLYLLTDGPLSDRTISATNEDGTYQSFVTAGVKGAIFALPEVNAVVAEHSMAEGGFA